MNQGESKLAGWVALDRSGASRMISGNEASCGGLLVLGRIRRELQDRRGFLGARDNATRGRCKPFGTTLSV